MSELVHCYFRSTWNRIKYDEGTRISFFILLFYYFFSFCDTWGHMWERQRVKEKRTGNKDAWKACPLVFCLKESYVLCMYLICLSCFPGKEWVGPQKNWLLKSHYIFFFTETFIVLLCAKTAFENLFNDLLYQSCSKFHFIIKAFSKQPPSLETPGGLGIKNFDF